MTLPIMTGYTAAVLGIIQIALMVTTGNARRQFDIPIGDKGNETLLYKVRRHGNFTENAPIFLILLALLEVTGGAHSVVMGLALIFVVTRLSHAYALSGPGKAAAARALGAMGTMIGILGASGMLLWQLSQLH